MLKTLALKFLTSFGTPQPQIKDLPVSSIRVRPVYALDFEKITPLIDAYDKSKDHLLPPIDVMKIGNNYYLFDGQHRLALRAHNGHATIPVSIMNKENHPHEHLYTHDVGHLLEHIDTFF